jgi:hypothetical protein
MLENPRGGQREVRSHVMGRAATTESPDQAALCRFAATITTSTVEAGGKLLCAGVANVNIPRYDGWRALPGTFRRSGRSTGPRPKLFGWLMAIHASLSNPLQLRV